MKFTGHLNALRTDCLTLESAVVRRSAVPPTMVASVEFADFLKELLAPLGAVSVRRMFGKSGVFIEGVMLGMVSDNTLYLRVDTLNQAFFQEAAASPPLNYEKRGEMIDLSFWRLPDRLLDEPEEFIAWARSALAAAHRVASKRRSHPTRRRS